MPISMILFLLVTRYKHTCFLLYCVCSFIKPKVHLKKQIFKNLEIMKQITHVLFDFDGTLVNTIDCIERVIEEIIAEYGKEITNEIRSKLNGLLIIFL